MNHAPDRIKPPALPTRRLYHPDGRHSHEVWCPWCEENHSHGEGEGQRGAHCADYDGRSPLHATGYEMGVIQRVRASGDLPRFPAGRGFVGERRFWRSIADFAARPLQKALIEAIAGKKMRGGKVMFKIRRLGGDPGARVEISYCWSLGWSVVYTDGEASCGSDLASLISKLFAISPGVIFVRVLEPVLNVKLDARARLEIWAAGDAWRDRVSPKNKGSRS